METGGRLKLSSSWRDWLALVAFVVSGFVWFLKLDYREQALSDAIAEQRTQQSAAIAKIEAQLAAGVLPRTDERLRAHEHSFEELQRQIDDLKRVKR